MNNGRQTYKRIVKRLRTEYGIQDRVCRAQMADLVMWGKLTEARLFQLLDAEKAESSQ